jgi:CheY-like chemotaxis protein
MARVAVVCPDLLYGSKVEGALRAAGHAVERIDDEPGAWEAVRAGVDALVVDLGAEELDGAVLVDSLRSDGALGGVATLGFYPHVERETRERAEAVGFDLVVPRSRMAREAGALVERALASAAAARARE